MSTTPAPHRTIFFHPDQPQRRHLIWHVVKAAGWTVARTRDEADLCMLFQDVTTLTLAPDDPFADESTRWANGRMRDISKRSVQRSFAAIFGYPLAIDPLTHVGPALRKSDQNYTKDGVVITCPLAPAEIDDRYVYERLIDSTIAGLGFRDLRAIIVGGQIAFLQKKITRNWIADGYVHGEVIDRSTVLPETELSPQERDLLWAFCLSIGCDFGALDILRDNADQRIYVVDANNTPGRAFAKSLPRDLAQDYLSRLAAALSQAFPAGPLPSVTHPRQAG